MIVEISCELYARLVNIPFGFDETDSRKYFKSLFIERRNGKLYAVATNGKILACEYLGANDGPDESLTVVADLSLAEQCVKELQYNSTLTISYNEMLGYTSVRSKYGHNHPGNAHVQLAPTSEFYSWRRLLPSAMPTKNNGVMYWTTDEISRLSDAAPSGSFRMPAFMDIETAILVRDVESDNWLGLFMARKPNDKVIAATVPEWI